MNLSGKTWTENRLKYFTYPWNMTRDQALTFCLNNNGTLMYWANITEQDILQSKKEQKPFFLIFN